MQIQKPSNLLDFLNAKDSSLLKEINNFELPKPKSDTFDFGFYEAAIMQSFEQRNNERKRERKGS